MAAADSERDQLLGAPRLGLGVGVGLTPCHQAATAMQQVGGAAAAAAAAASRLAAARPQLRQAEERPTCCSSKQEAFGKAVGGSGTVQRVRLLRVRQGAGASQLL